jgi:histidyl-tRNA synthetase
MITSHQDIIDNLQRRTIFLEITTIKGFKDILPDETALWQWVEAEARAVFHAFGFKEIRTPLLEKTEVFTRGIGQDTDIVSKEMYTLKDSKGDGMTMRPEATASVVRAYIQNRLYQDNPVQKLYYIGPMFRHERPQKGRFRQFHQIGVELFGDPGPVSDADVIIMAMHLFNTLGIKDLSLLINSLGCPACRNVFRDRLRAYLAERSGPLCEDCRKRSETNPLRVFDCKVEACKEVVSGAPSILDSICDDCRRHFSLLKECLDNAGVQYAVNHKLVRGLDYYSGTTFEIQTDRLGAQNAVAGGGRYNGLVRDLGGPDCPGIGFALGVERLVALAEERIKKTYAGPEVFMAGLGEQAEKKVFGWVTELRRSGISAWMEYGSKGLKAQMKRADRLGAKRTLIVGDDEIFKGKGILRDMAAKTQEEIGLDNIVEGMKRIIGG